MTCGLATIGPGKAGGAAQAGCILRELSATSRIAYEGWGRRRPRWWRGRGAAGAPAVEHARPGDLCGVAIPHPADLENALSSFIAHGHPAWRLHRVNVYAVTVAVIEVPPPRDGDRICCLQHSYDASQAGRIYVRLQGQTSEATPDVVRAREHRMPPPHEAASRAATPHEHGNDLMTQQLALQLERDTRDAETAPSAMPRRIVVHGASGYRSSIGASVIRRHGFTQIADLVGGIGAWEAAGLGRAQVAGTAPTPPAVGAWTAGGCGRRGSRGGRGACELAMGAWAPRRRRRPRTGGGSGTAWPTSTTPGTASASPRGRLGPHERREPLSVRRWLQAAHGDHEQDDCERGNDGQCHEVRQQCARSSRRLLRGR
jgi:hypothetical protein